MPKAPPNHALPISAPLQLENAAAADWDEHCDVLVIGCGAAGAAVSLEAHEAGLDVLTIDRFGHGGATAQSGGVIYAGGGTRQQHEAGIKDSPENMFAYLRQETGDAVSEETLMQFCEDSTELLSWLENLGAEYQSSKAPPKTSYPKDGTYLYFSGNEAVAPYCEKATPVPRGHRTVDSGLSGQRLYNILDQQLNDRGIRRHALCAAMRLVIAEGRVVGAEVRQIPAGSRAAKRHQRMTAQAEKIHNYAPARADSLRKRAATLESRYGKTRLIRTKQAVTLTTGGFIFNREMLTKYAPIYRQNMRIGTAGCDGSGIRLGESAGGIPDRMEKISAWRFINPPTSWPQGMVINAKAKRFANEMSYGAKLGVDICETQDGKAWLILDAKLRAAAMLECRSGGLWVFQRIPALLLMWFSRKANSIEALARKIAVDAEALQATIGNYNDAAHQRIADPFGKAANHMQALETPPYTAINIGNNNPLFPCPTITLGGLRVNENSGAVVDANGDDIPGLFAAGRAAVGVASNGYVSGLSLADCFWSGRRAAAAIAKQALATKNQELTKD